MQSVPNDQDPLGRLYLRRANIRKLVINGGNPDEKSMKWG
jgi:hypothetical protein